MPTDSPRNILVAVAWPYANGPRHIGHVAGYGVPSDVFARFHRLRGDRVLMVSGTDEHGTPITFEADREGVSPREIADRYSRVIMEDNQALGLSYDLFTRTTTRTHYRVVQELFKKLLDNGYIALKDGATGEREWFGDVDWTKTRAFAMGLNGVYINQRGRERHGIVEPGAATQELRRELCRKLTGLADPASGRVGITEALDRRAVYHGPYVEGSPDLVICYARGFRAAWESVKGQVSGEVFSDNQKAWSGDHCGDPRLVPGVLFSNHKIEAADPAIVDVAPTMLDIFGVKVPRHFDGKPWAIPSL